MKQLVELPLNGVEDSGDELFDQGLWYDTAKDVGYFVQIPYMSEVNLIDLFDNVIEQYFYRQGGYLKKCMYCGNLFPFFPFGIAYSHCLECKDKSSAQAEKCRASFEKEEQKIEAAREKARTRKQRLKEEAEAERNRLSAERAEEPPTITNKDVGFVYLMRASSGQHKIGIAKDVEKRKEGIERANPIDMVIVHYFASNNYRRVERLLHRRYIDQRIKYEWFDLSPEQVDQICRIADYDLDEEAASFPTANEV